MTREPDGHRGPGVKICGLREEGQIDDCLRAGVRACGLVLANRGPRALSPGRAREMLVYARRTPMATVFVFMDQRADFIRSCLDTHQPDYLQFHGDEPPEFCAQFGVKAIKACPVERFADDGAGGKIDFQDMAAFYRRYEQASAILLDHKDPGSGRSWRWQALPEELSRRTVIAGGLGPANVAEALATTGCAAVDASSGVESRPGVKSAGLIAEFAAAAASAGAPDGAFVFERAI